MVRTQYTIPGAHSANGCSAILIKHLILNIGILILTTWLVYAAVMRDVFATHSTPPFTIACFIAQDVVVIWAIYSIFITTTIPFFLGECRIRLRWGFRPVEVIFIRALPSEMSIDSLACRDLHMNHYRRLATGPLKSRLYTNLWSFITSDSWVLVDSAVIEAYDLIDNGEIDETLLESTVWWQENGAWRIYEVRRTDDRV